MASSAQVVLVMGQPEQKPFRSFSLHFIILPKLGEIDPSHHHPSKKGRRVLKKIKTNVSRALGAVLPTDGSKEGFLTRLPEK